MAFLPCLIFLSKAGSYPNEEPFRLQALPTNIRLGWKGMPGTNTLAHYEHSYIMAAKSFITLGPKLNNSSSHSH
jgi:hypothetical protein